MELYQLGVILALLAVGLVVIAVLIIRKKRAAAEAMAEQEPDPQAVAYAPEPVAQTPATAEAIKLPKAGKLRREPVDPARMSQRLSDLGQRNRDLPSASFRHEVEERLTAAFDLFEQQRITLDTFKKLVRAERAEAQRRLTAFSEGSADVGVEGDDVAEVTRAYEMTEQCLIWADGFGGASQRA